MYPDTDLPPKQVTEERLARIRRDLPVPVWTREAWYRELGLPADVVEPLAVSRWAGLFEMMVKDWGLGPTAAAVAWSNSPSASKRKGLDPSLLTEDALRRIFALYRDRRISRDGVFALIGAGRPRPGPAGGRRGPAGDRGGDPRPGRGRERRPPGR